MSAEHEYAIELQGVSFQRGARSIFDKVDIRIPRGKVTGIMGPSGCGKTTLLPVSYTHLTLPTILRV